MKILIATAVYYPQVNGVAVFSHNLARGLAARGHEVVVVCPSLSGRAYSETQDGVEVRYLRSVEAKVYPDQVHSVPERRKILGMNLPRLWYRHGFRVSVFPGAEIAKILRELRPEVVHVQVSDPIGLSVVWHARKFGIPVVTTEHNQPEVLTDPLKMPTILKKPANYLLSAYFRNRQSKSDFVTMPTERAIRELLGSSSGGLRRRDGAVVPVAAVSNGVDLSCFKPGEASEEIRQKYGLEAGAPTVLYVGRVDPEKRVGVVIEAFSRARTDLPEGARLLIVGDGVDRVRLSGKVRDLGLSGVVKFLGKVLPPDLYELYKVGDVFATASEIETQGIVLIEAAASGLPLIAVDKGAVAEVCQDRVNGVLCAARDVEAMATAMVNILTDDGGRKRMAAASLKIASEHDFEKTLDRFENIYRKVTVDRS